MARRKKGAVVRKILLWAGLVTLLLSAVAGVAYRHAAANDYYFSEISKITRERAGFELVKTGPLALSLLPHPTLTARSLEIRNPALDEHALIAKVSTLSVSAPWSALLRLQLDLHVALNAPRVSLRIDTDGTRNWMTPELEEISGDLPFDLVRIDSSELQLLFENHATGEVLGVDIHQFDVDLREERGSARVETAGRLGPARFFLVGDVERRGSGEGFALALDFGAGRARQRRVDAASAPSVSWWIRQNAVLFPLQGAIKGAVAFEQQLPSGTLDLELAAGNLDEFLHMFGDLPTLRTRIGPIRGRGRVLLSGSDIDVAGFEAAIQQPELNLEVRGELSNLLSIPKSRLNVALVSDDLNAIVDSSALIPGVGAELGGRPLRLKLDANVESEGPAIFVHDAAARLSQGVLSARIGGRGRLARDDLEFEARLDASAPDSKDLARILSMPGHEQMSPSPMRVSAVVTGSREQLVIREAYAEFDDGRSTVRVAGNVGLAGPQPVMDVEAGVDMTDAAVLREYLQRLPHPLLDDLAVSVKSDIQGPLDDFAMRDIEVKMVQGDRELVATGRVSGLPADPRMDVSFTYTLPEHLALDDYLPQLGRQRLMGPLSLSATVGFADRRLNVDDLSLRAERSDVTGMIAVDFSKTPAKTVVIMESERFETILAKVEEEAIDSADPGTTESEGSASSADAGEPSPADARDPGEVFQDFTHSIEINTKWIDELDLYLSFTAQAARLGDYHIDNLDVILDARDGVFTVARYEITLGGRPVTLRGYIDANPDPPAYLFTGSIEKETLEALLNLEEQLVEGGELSGRFVFLSEGENLGEVIRHLDGRALFEMGPVAIRSKALDIVASDVLHSMLSGITQSKEERKTTRYECGVLGIETKAGVALIDKSFTLQAKDYNLSGKGKLDLNTGYVELAARPRAKKGLGLSLSSLVGGFSVEGHVATPRFGLRGGGVVSAALVGYALSPGMAAAAANPATATIVATGFVAKGIFDRLTASSYSCARTLQRIESSRRRQVVPRSPHSGKMGF